MRLRTSIVALLAAAGMLLSGCGGSGGHGDTVELKWWLVTQQDTAQATLDELIDNFEEANPDITISLETRSVDAHKDALRTSAGTDAGPDIFYMWTGPGLGGEFVQAGVSKDISNYYEQYRWADRFTPTTIEPYTQYGGHHGVPWTQRVQVIYYNKRLFQQAGITAEPTTYEELVTAADRLKAAGITPIEFGGSVNWHVMRLLDNLIETECGPEKADQLTSRTASWAGEPCVDVAFTELKTWSDSYFNQGFIGIDNDESSVLFHTGKAAMALEGDWFTTQITDGGGNIDEIGIFPFPTGADRLYGFSEGMYIGARSAHPNEAARFLDYLTSAEVQRSIGGVFAATSVNKDATSTGDVGPIRQRFAELGATSSGFHLNNDQNFPLNVTTEYWRIQNSVLTGSIAPADAGEALQAFIDGNA
ncbi:extracellular solute-binding protein [Pseudonocardia sp. DSM 110487]|uniref:ABC transporter substrate-binding protein n=1 Tax=Pseudonocardia sp. DSM 110487 TaxID=2865833 RepID=UPI001C698FF2|nr:extracellular solute-binding protein [Pseudonocardia sp. DSM 110487]QYN38787.1 extracellular solute-binding protein [Pseudonocardia sp. DSM 110487]